MFWPELLATTLYGRIPKIHIFHSAFVCHHFLGGKCLESIFFQQIIKYLNPNMMNYKQSSLKHRFVKQKQASNPFETSPKSQNIEPISMPEIGWIQDQIWKNWTTNPARFLLYQNLNKISHSSLTSSISVSCKSPRWKSAHFLFCFAWKDAIKSSNCNSRIAE